MVDDLHLIVKTYTRVFVSQGVGIVGLLWCLSEGMTLFGVVLTVLVLIDQAIFLKARFAPDHDAFPYRTALNLVCFCVSALDVLVLFAILFRSLGLRDTVHGTATNDPLDCLSFSVATFAHAGIDLAGATGGGRLLAASEGLIGAVALIAILAATLPIRRPR